MSAAYSSTIRRIAVIGAGPTGVACARYLQAERAFDKIDVFEQRRTVGGIWNLSDNHRSRNIPVPQIDPNYGTAGKPSDGGSLEFESPLYDYLETNIPKVLMAYSDFPFDQDLPLFPKHAQVLSYLEQYTEPVRDLIQLQTQVENVEPLPIGHEASALNQKWRLSIRNLITDEVYAKSYDAVIFANGHYTVPHIPKIMGIVEWNQKYPNTILHSKAYRRPEDFRGKKVLVIGNSASGLDIAAQLAPYAEHPVYLSSRSASQLAPSEGGPSWRKDVAEVAEFLVNDDRRSLLTKDGKIFHGFDNVIFATGYFYSFPFLSKASQTSTSTSATASPSSSTNSLSSQRDSSTLSGITTSGLRTHRVYKHFLHMDHPSLALPVLNLKIIPFPLAENQAAVLARLWSGRLDLPSMEVMQEWEREEEERLIQAGRLRPAGNTASGDSVVVESDESAHPDREGGFHTLVYPEDAAQINKLYDWAASARPQHDLPNDGVGKLGTRWGERQVWLRGRFPDVKAAYAKYGDERTKITSLDMLGEDWKTGFERWKEVTPEDEQRDLFQKAAVRGW